MKIIAINGAISGYDYEIPKISKIINDTLLEIGESIDIIDLFELDMYYCNNTQPNYEVSNLINNISECQGIIFMTPVHLFAPSAIMQTFLEYLSLPIYKNILKDKNCMILTVSNSGGSGQRDCLEYFSKFINFLGGYDSVRLPLSYGVVKTILSNEENKISVEKYVEDFYRICKQNRKFFTPSDSGYSIKPPSISNPLLANAKQIKREELQNNNSYVPQGQQIQKQSSSFQSGNNVNVSSTANQKQILRENLKSIENFNTKQFEDVEEISKLISNKFNRKNVINEELTAKNESEIKPRLIGCKQLTQNLTHYYQPQLEPDLSCIFQFIVEGNENFQCYLWIKNGVCEFNNGVSSVQPPDVTIMAKDSELRKVLENNLSAQRAFMTGQIKVRGNFILLSKFDQLFKR